MTVTLKSQKLSFVYICKVIILYSFIKIRNQIFTKSAKNSVFEQHCKDLFMYFQNHKNQKDKIKNLHFKWLMEAVTG